MAYSLPEWVNMGAIPGTAEVDIGLPLDHSDGRRLRGKMTWCNFLAYLQRCSLSVRKSRFSDLGQEIGRGRFFEVFRYQVREGERQAFSTQKGDFLEAGTVVALKRVIPQVLEDNRVSLNDSRQLRAVAAEIQALTKKSLQEHENIIDMYALAWEDRGGEAVYWPTMIMEYCPCTLAELQSERKSPLSLKLKIQIIQGVGFGFDALQEEEIIHGDIKSENILIQVMDDGLLIPKLADFGSSVVEINSDFVQIGGTDPWRAPECVALKGKVPTDLALGTDCYSLGLLYWRIFLNGQNPFASLNDLDYMSGNSSNSDKDLRLEIEEEHKSKIIQDLKLSGAVIQMFISDIDKLCVDHPGGLDGFKIIISATLTADPAARQNALNNLKEGLEVETTASVEGAVEDVDRHEYSGLNIKLNQLPTSVFSVHQVVRFETVDADFYSGKPTQRRVFQELLELVQDWDSQKNIECPACCAFSCFDKSTEDTICSLDNYFQCIMEEADRHTCINNNAAFAYNVPGWDLMGSQNEIFIAVINLFVCYVEGYGTDIDVDEGLRWLLKAAKWGSAIAQGELATCFLQARKAIPSSVPIIKWAMHSIVKYDSIPPKNALAILDPVCLKIACAARQKMFDGVSVGIDNQLLDPGKDIKIDEYDREMNQNLAQRHNISLNGVNEEGHSEDEGEEWGGNGPLHLIASSWRQPLDLCREYIHKYPGLLNAGNRNEETPLLLACRSGRLSMVTTLLSLGADATTCAGVGGETPLHWIALMDHEDVFHTIQSLLNHKADVNALAIEPRLYPWRPPRAALIGKPGLIYVGSPLHWAVLARRIENVKLLVREGAFIDLPNSVGMTALSIAVSLRRSDILKVLLEGKRCADNNPGDRDLFRHLYMDSTKYTRMLQEFTLEDEERTLELILDLCPLTSGQSHIDDFYKWVVCIGIFGMPINILRKLLEKLDHCYTVSNFENPGLSGLPLVRECWQKLGLLHSAIKRNDPQVLDLFLQKGVDIKELDNMSYTCLHTLAVHQGSEDCLRVLIKHGAQVDWRTNLGWLPIHFAIFVGNTKIAQALKELMSPQQFEDALGIIISTKSSRFPAIFLGQAILLRSMSFANTRGIEWLLDLPDRVLDFKAVCPDGGYTPLHLAVDGLDFRSRAFKSFGGLPILRLLLARFRDPEHLEARSKNNLTALHLAAWLGKLEETRLLVEAGADINALSPEGSPLDCTFAPPPSLLNEQSLGPTREQIKRFMEGRNAVAKYLRSQGSKCGEEIILKVTLGDWVPYGINSGEHVEYFQSSSFARRRRGWSRYGRPVPIPQLKPERFMQDDLTARELVIPEKIPDWAVALAEQDKVAQELD